MNVTYNVRIWGIVTNKLAKNRKSYSVRWAVEGRETPHRKTFTSKALAEAFRSKLMVAHREGIAFDVDTGLPVTMLQKPASPSWFAHAMAYVDLKWSRVSAKHRQSIADGLSYITLALTTTDVGKPSYGDLRDVMYGWAFNRSRRENEPVPPHLVSALSWLETNTVSVDQLHDTGLVRKALDSLTVRSDGAKSAPSSVARKRAVFSGALRYAVECGHLDGHPFDRLSWVAPRNSDELDQRTVPNPEQVERLLAWIRGDSPDFEAFFGAMYYCGLRPQEVLHIRKDDYEPPDSEDGWGWLLLTGAFVATAQGWTDNDSALEARPLKWRGEGATRRVPVPPEQCERFKRHLERFGANAEGLLFVTRRFGKGKYRSIGTQPFSRAAYSRVWKRSREAVLTPAQVASPLAKIPYHLRAACVSRWLAEGVPPQQAAAWAGHSLPVLMRIYAKVIDQQEAEVIRRMDEQRKSRRHRSTRDD